MQHIYATECALSALKADDSVVELYNAIQNSIFENVWKMKVSTAFVNKNGKCRRGCQSADMDVSTPSVKNLSIHSRVPAWMSAPLL